MAGISVGSVSVDIVPDTTNFRRELNAKLKDLTVPVRLNLNDKAFKTELDAATRNRDVNVRVDDKGTIGRTQGRTHALVTTLALLAPAAAPLTAVAIGGAAALAGLGAAGILAFKGIQDQMKTGTPLGLQYAGVIGGLKNELTGLEAVAARGVLTGFTQSAGILEGNLPTLRREVDSLSRSIGSDLAPVTAGLLGIFHDLFPTTAGLAGSVHNLAVGFEGWANGPGGRAFAAYLAQELPIVVDTLVALGSAGAHVVQALLPLGGPVLQAIKGISDVIGALPVWVIKDLYIAFLGYKVVTMAAAAATAFQVAIKALGLTALTTTGQIGALTLAESRFAQLGPIGLGAAIGGAGALKTLPLFGVGAISGEITNDPISRAQKNFATEHPNAGKTGFSDFVSSTKNNPAAGAQLKAYMSESYKAKSATDALNSSIGTQTAKINADADALKSWVKAQDKAFQTSLDQKSATIGAAQAVADATAALKANGRTLDLHTQKGRDNRTALLNLATAEHTKIDADTAAGASQKTITGDIVAGHHQLVIMAEKFGLSKRAAERYANSLLAIPKNVLTTVTVNGIAKSAAQIAALKRAEGALNFYAGQKQPAGGGYIHRAEGGPVWGAGTATSDSIPAFLSDGEFVVKAATVKAIGAPFLHQMNATGMMPGSAAPTTFNLYDADGHLIGRMRGEAAAVADQKLYMAGRQRAAGRR